MADKNDQIISKCFWLRARVPQLFCSRERNFHHLFAPGSESSMTFSFPGTKPLQSNCLEKPFPSSIIIIIFWHAPCQCVAPLATNSLHSDLSKASSIASSKVRLCRDTSLFRVAIQEVGAPNWPTRIALMDTSQNPPGVSCLVYSGQVAKQHESSFLYDSRAGRLFRHMPHFAVGSASSSWEQKEDHNCITVAHVKFQVQSQDCAVLERIWTTDFWSAKIVSTKSMEVRHNWTEFMCFVLIQCFSSLNI